MRKKATYKALQDVTEADKKYYLCGIGRTRLDSVTLRYSRPVAKGRSHKGEESIVSSADPSQNKPSARVSRDKTKTLDRGIQLYRLWFNYLKLALELEAQGVSIVTKQHTYIKNAMIEVEKTGNQIQNPAFRDIPESVLVKSKHNKGGAAGEASGLKQIFRCRQVQKVTVSRSKYKGWDLDDVLTNSFDKWWKTHSHLFEGHYPTFIDSKDEWVDDPNFVYVRIDKTSQWTDVQSFMQEQLSKAIKTEGRPRYKISGLPRSNVLQNNFNALVLSLQGVSPKDICTNKDTYLRKTDENLGASRTSGDRLTVSTNKSGKSLYSVAVSKQRVMGIHHLFEVCEGRFGYAPPSK
jgi:hypothetical protein